MGITPTPVGQVPRKGDSHLWDTINEARSRSSGCSVGDLEGKLRDLMQEHASVIRTGPGLQEAMGALEALRSAFYDRLCLPGRPESWHPEWLAAVEIANMLEVSQALLVSALVRTESRGAHYRDDYPDSDEAWKGHNLIVQGHGQEMTVSRLDRASREKRKVWP